MSNLSPRAIALQQAHGPGPVDWERVAEIVEAAKIGSPTVPWTQVESVLRAARDISRRSKFYSAEDEKTIDTVADYVLASLMPWVTPPLPLIPPEPPAGGAKIEGTGA